MSRSVGISKIVSNTIEKKIKLVCRMVLVAIMLKYVCNTVYFCILNLTMSKWNSFLCKAPCAWH